MYGYCLLLKKIHLIGLHRQLIMDKFKKKMINFKASDVEACRVCLATDVKMHSLQDAHLATCLKTVTGFNNSYEGLPKYVCFECAPVLIKCNELIKKSKSAQATLLNIFVKNGKINKPLIKQQNRSQLKLESTLDSYLLLNYFYIKYDDDNNTSQFIKTESDPNEQINIKIKNEVKEETSDELSSSEILKMFKTSIDACMKGNEESEKFERDSDVEAVEEPNPVIEITSDDGEFGDDFLSLKTYKVKIDRQPQKSRLRRNDVPIYHVPKVRGISKKGKKKKKKVFDHPDTLSYVPYGDEAYVKKYFNVYNKTAAKLSKTNKYSCKFCSESFKNVKDAKDHTFIGCKEDNSVFEIYGQELYTTREKPPVLWKELTANQK